MVYKDHHLKEQKLVDILKQYPAGSKILIVFWHGLGDTLMFLPLMEVLNQEYSGQYTFDLGLLPGVGQADYVKHHRLYTEGVVCEIPENEFLAKHVAAFVVSFPMCEGVPGAGTKTEYCCVHELGFSSACLTEESMSDVLYIPPVKNRLVGLHLQGTCLPGSTNPDVETARCLWEDVLSAGGVPIDLHFVHAFHNPENAPFPWVTRHCRDLPPDLLTLQMMMEQCAVIVAVASGPMVMALTTYPNRLIYLQKNHNLSSYTNYESAVRAILSLPDYAADHAVASPVRQTFRDQVANIIAQGVV